MGVEETLTAKLQFDGNNAIQGMQRASTAFKGMEIHAKRARAGIKDIGKGFQGFGIAMAGVGAGAASAVKKLSDFDGQMGAVKAVLGKDAAPAFEALEMQATKLGATTSFTATQSAEAMENLARAGFDAQQIMSAVPEVLAAAAAEGMDLGTAADIVASNIKAFQLEAKEAGRVADALAFVSAKTNTNMISLQEGLKFAAPVAKNMGIQMEDAAAAIGVLADVGLKGSLAGTGLKNALLKIATSAKDGAVKVGGMRAEIVKAADGGVDLSKTMFNIVARLQEIKEPTRRAQASMKLLGLRGMGAAAAFDALGTNQKLVNTLFNDMRGNAAGAAKNMQAMRLDTLQGDFQLLSSAVDGFMISIGKALRDFIQPMIAGGKGLSETIQQTGQAITTLWGAGSPGAMAIAEQDLAMQGMNKSVIQFASGFVDGIRSAASIFGTFVDTIKGGLRFFGALFGQTGLMGEGGSGVRGTTKLVIQAAALGVTLKVATGMFKRFASVATGSIKLVSGVLGGVKTGLTGTVTVLSQRFPSLAKKLPGMLGRLGGAVSAVDKATANPVRVVNFDEMGGFGGIGGPKPLPGQMDLFGSQTATGAGGATKPMSRLGKVASAAGKSVGVLGAAIAGWQIGKAIDQAFGLSDAISDFALKSTGAMEAHKRLARLRLQKGALITGKETAATQAKFFADLASKGIKLQPSPKADKKVAVTREFARQKILQRVKHEPRMIQEAVLASVQPILDRIPTKEDLLKRPPTVIQMDSRQVGVSVSRVTDENRDRGAGTGIFAVSGTRGAGPRPRRASNR